MKSAEAAPGVKVDTSEAPEPVSAANLTDRVQTGVLVQIGRLVTELVQAQVQLQAQQEEIAILREALRRMNGRTG